MKYSMILTAFLLSMLTAFAEPTLVGLYTSEGKYYFSLLDEKGVKSNWLNLGQKFDGFTLSGYAPDTEELSLSKESRPYKIKLRRAKINQVDSGSDVRAELEKIRKAVFNNLRQISAAADQYFLENGVNKVTLDKLVGPDKYIREVIIADGENYGELDLSQSVHKWRITTAKGAVITFER